MTENLQQKVQQWFIDRNLQKANPVQQFHKLLEEMGELSAAIARQKSDDIKDAIGDIQVVLTGLKLQLENKNDISLSEQDEQIVTLLHNVYNIALVLVISRTKENETPNNRNIEYIKSEIDSIIENNLERIAQLNNTTNKECLAMAYKEIKDRKGKLINGVFVKEADL